MFRKLVILLFVFLLMGCSPIAVDSTASPTVANSVIGSQQLPNRYIDWQAGVVCYYLGDTAISCLPITDTTIYGMNK